MSTPNTENYMLGRGSLFAAVYNPTTNTYGGDRHLGNASAVTVALGVDKLEHFSSMSGLKAKDKSVVSQLSPTLSFTLDEFDGENWRMLVYGSSSVISQAAVDHVTDVTIATPEKGKYYDLGFRGIQTNRMTIGTVTGGPFQAGETITGGTSSATAKVIQVSTGVLVVNTITGTFQAAETITGGTSTATAAISTIPAAVTGLVVANHTTTFYTPTTDYIVDAVAGRIQITPDSTISGALTIQFGVKAVSYTKITALTSLSQEVRVRFISDNPEGNNFELHAWRVALAPDGDTGLIGDDWATMAFTGEILRDQQNNPDSPYMDLLVFDQA